MNYPVICAKSGKKIFRTPEDAERRRRLIRRNHDDRLHSYRCEHCKFWHLGHGSKSIQEEDRKAG